MDFKQYLLGYCKNLNKSDVNEYSMDVYDNFHNFISKHYSLNHMKNHNYIKYVKVMRQKLLDHNPKEYNYLLNKIDSLIQILQNTNLFPKLNINKYLFKIFKFLKLLDIKKKNLEETIVYYQKLYEEYNDKYDVKFKILMNINGIYTKFSNFVKISKEIKYYISKLIILEEEFDIDHKLIEINNMERGLIGKKSEYILTNH